MPTLLGSESALAAPGEDLRIVYSLGKSYSPNKSLMTVKITNRTGGSFDCWVTEKIEEKVFKTQEYFTYEFEMNGGLSNPSIRADIYAFYCRIDERTPQGIYNISVENSQYGEMPFSKYGFTQMSINDELQQKYMVKVVRRVFSIGQNYISYLGGYLKIQGYNLTLDGVPEISYEGRNCKIESQTSADEVTCSLSSLNPPFPRKHFAGNAGVLQAKKECLINEYEEMVRTYVEFDPTGYTVTTESSFNEVRSYSKSTCIRKQAIIKVPISMQFQIGPICSPAFCSLRISENGLGKQEQLKTIKTVESFSVNNFFSFLVNFDLYKGPIVNIYSENDYLVDFVQFSIRSLQ